MKENPLNHRTVPPLTFRRLRGSVWGLSSGSWDLRHFSRQTNQLHWFLHFDGLRCQRTYSENAVVWEKRQEMKWDLKEESNALFRAKTTVRKSQRENANVGNFVVDI